LELDGKKIIENNCIYSLFELIKRLSINASLDLIKEITNSHPNYPSLLSISDTLSELKIKNKAIQISNQQLSYIQPPMIAHLQSDEWGYFVVITQINKDGIHYIKPSEGKIKESLESFGNKWKGIVLIAEKGKMEKNIFSAKSVENIVKLIRTILIYFIPVSFLLAMLYSASKHSQGGVVQTVLLFLTNIIGFYLSWLLVNLHIGSKIGFMSKICSISKIFDCKGVLQSNASKLMGVSLAEMGLIFFTSVLTMLSLGIFLNKNSDVLSGLFYLSVLPIPYSFYSIRYQKVTAKAWCPLCMSVMLIFWLNFFILILGQNISEISWSALKIIVLSFVSIIWIWLIARDPLAALIEIQYTKVSFLRMKRDPKIIAALLASEPFEIKGEFDNEMVCGKITAPNTITMITNPTCSHCQTAHTQLSELVNILEDQVKVVFRFFGDANLNSLSAKVSMQIIGLATSGHFDANRALTSWFSGKFKKYTDWPEHNLNGFDINNAEETYKKHREWSISHMIKGTPAIFINGKKLPKEINISDLKYYLKEANLS
jgi:uncharacterized membrane protein/glutaredoxin